MASKLRFGIYSEIQNGYGIDYAKTIWEVFGLIETPRRQTRSATGAAPDSMAVTRRASLRKHRFTLFHHVRHILRPAGRRKR